MLLVGAIVLVDTMFFAAITPLLPEYSERLDLSKADAGVLSASYAVGALVGSLPAGWLAARWGVRPTVLLGLAVLGVSSVVFGFADSVVAARRRAVRTGRGRRRAVGGRAGLADRRGAARPARRADGRRARARRSSARCSGPALGALASVAGTEATFTGVAAVAALLAVLASARPRRPPATRTTRAGSAARCAAGWSRRASG